MLPEAKTFQEANRPITTKKQPEKRGLIHQKQTYTHIIPTRPTPRKSIP